MNNERISRNGSPSTGNQSDLKGKQVNEGAFDSKTSQKSDTQRQPAY